MTLLLPERIRFAGQTIPEPVASALGRADRMPDGGPGERAQLLRRFDLLPRGWPVAALTRQADAGDAAPSAWLRADPAWVRPDINGARLFACGEGLQLAQEDVDALLPALRPLFGDVGFIIDAPLPSRWYLRLPREAKLPAFTEPEDVLGADVFDYLSDLGTEATGEDRRWRALLSEAQVVLHNHPWNARRAAAGKPPVNSLWFWGGGVLPDHVATTHRAIQSDDVLLRALAIAAQVTPANLAPRFDAAAGQALIDQRAAHDLTTLSEYWLQPMLAALRNGAIARAVLDCVDGAGYVLERRQRWRFWRRPLPIFDSTQPPRPTP